MRFVRKNYRFCPPSNDLKNFDDAKIGVIAGSIFSVIAGGLVAWWIKRNRQTYSK